MIVCFTFVTTSLDVVDRLNSGRRRPPEPTFITLVTTSPDVVAYPTHHTTTSLEGESHTEWLLVVETLLVITSFDVVTCLSLTFTWLK